MTLMKKRLLTMILKKHLYKQFKQALIAQMISVSAKMRCLLRKVSGLEEDAYWVKAGETRLATFDRSKALTHKQVWK